MQTMKRVYENPMMKVSMFLSERLATGDNKLVKKEYNRNQSFCKLI